MIDTNKALKFLEHFSLVTVGENKKANFSWKEQQVKKLSPDKFKKHYEYRGGIIKSCGEEIAPTTNFGIVTGFEDLEVVDVDLKVLSTTKEKKDIWEEMLSLFRDAIFDFDEKFVIYKTQKEGFHILYKTKRVEKNQKLAKLKGHKEAILETRGFGGYVFAYPEKRYSDKSYFEIEYISDEDREALITICKSFNYEEPKETVDVKIKNKYVENVNTLTPWDDFNNQTSVWDVVSDDFVVVKDTKKRIFVKRHGATSAHSGYIYKDDNLMYLFSTGTIYPHETQISPYVAFTYKYHNGDFSKSAKDLYEQGFGDRLKSEIKEVEDKIEINETLIERYNFNKDNLNFPIEVFPEYYQNYIIECHDKLDLIIDYMGCALLWVTSLCVGNSFKVKVKNGWWESPTLWLSLVGKAGAGKTPSINQIIKPLEKRNGRLIKDYMRENKAFKEYEKLSKKEKENHVEIKRPNKKQFIANDITLEALVMLHESVPNGVGVFKDELAGWFKDMNKYRAGSDLEFWLSSWSGKSANLVRVTREDSYIEGPFIPVLGGIQPSILNDMYTEEKKNNGFMDRMLISYPETEIPERFNEEEISAEALLWFSDNITSMYEQLRKMITQDEEGNITQMEAVFSEGAKKLWIKKFEEISKLQNSDNENEYFKSMYPKQKSYIPRFAFLLHVLDSHQNDISNISYISEKSMEGAVKLSDYFVAMAKKVKIDKTEELSLSEIVKGGKDNAEKIVLAYNNNKNFNRTHLSELLGISRMTINRAIKKLETKKEK